MSIRKLATLTLFLLAVSAVIGWGALYTAVDFTFILFGGIGYAVAAVAAAAWGFIEGKNKTAIGWIAVLSMVAAVVWIVLGYSIG